MSSSESEIDDEPVVQSRHSEGNLKGFVSAYQTIMGRDVGVTVGLEPLAGAMNPKIPKRGEIIDDSIRAHNRQPKVRDECERELQFQGTAHRGIVKLFKAVAMHKRRTIEHEKSLGIGVDKTGRRRRLRPSKVVASTGTSPAALSGTSGMNTFLDALKKSRREPVADSSSLVE
jgi:hypothetical protein